MREEPLARSLPDLDEFPAGRWKRRRRPAAVFGDAAVIFGRTERVALRERHVGASGARNGKRVSATAYDEWRAR